MGDFAAISKMVVEVAVFAALIYFGLRFLRRTRGSNVLRGLLYLGVGGLVTFVLLIRAMDLARLSYLFETIAQSVVIALVVVFHPEIRRAIVHLGESQVFARLFRKEVQVVKHIARAVENMSKVRMGALIAIERGLTFSVSAWTATRSAKSIRAAARKKARVLSAKASRAPGIKRMGVGPDVLSTFTARPVSACFSLWITPRKGM
jgi:DNA integrity scanning protein DisA with diadenylate cyclase activity